MALVERWQQSWCRSRPEKSANDATTAYFTVNVEKGVANNLSNIEAEDFKFEAGNIGGSWKQKFTKK